MPQQEYDSEYVIPERGEQEQLGKFLLEIAPDLNNLRRNWLGLRVNTNWGKPDPLTGQIDYRDYIHDKNHSIVNEIGANSIFSDLMGALSKIVSVTNVGEDIIRNEVLFFHRNFNETLARNHLKWNLDGDHYRMLVSNAVNLVVAAWNASKGGMRMKLTLNPAMQREVIQTQTDVVEKQRKKLGVF